MINKKKYVGTLTHTYHLVPRLFALTSSECVDSTINLQVRNEHVETHPRPGPARPGHRGARAPSRPASAQPVRAMISA
ncbi:unnamed protein product, partial [Brenthis ino]